MPADAAILKSPAEHIKDLEKSAVAGDIAGMAKGIEQLRNQWDRLDDRMKADIQKLEAIFLSLVQLKAGGRS